MGEQRIWQQSDSRNSIVCQMNFLGYHGLYAYLFFCNYFILGYYLSQYYAAIRGFAPCGYKSRHQQFIFPIILTINVGHYVGFFSVFNNPHGPIAVAVFFISFDLPLVMICVLPGGQ